MRFRAALLALLACAAFSQEQKTARTLTVAAAANLTDVFTEVAVRFQARTGIGVVYSFGATANLTMQAEHAAPFDVFAAADVVHIDRLSSEGLLTPGSRAIYARGRLALWVPANSRAHIGRIEDLKNDEVKIVAVANPKLAPYGEATVETLRKLSLWNAIQPKIVYAETISAARQFAATGNADVAFTAYSLVIHAGGHNLLVPDGLHAPIDQAIGILKSSGRQPDARIFEDFLLGPAGRAIFEQYGYELPH